MPESRVPPPPAMSYWRRNVRLIVLLLALWAVLTATPALFTRYLAFDFIGWPFPFWLAAYGAPLAYLLIVALYAWTMNRADARAAAEAARAAAEAPAGHADQAGHADPARPADQAERAAPAATPGRRDR